MTSFREISNLERRADLERATKLPQRGVVDTVIAEQESVTIDVANFGGSSKMVVRHPYFGVNSWIRVMPEEGTAVLTQMRGDYHQLEIFGYISNSLPSQLRQATVDKKFLLKRLDRGEIEIRSAGRAYSHWGGNGDLIHRGGLIELGLLQSELEVKSIAPTHKRLLTFAENSSIGHEERFGVVKRPDADNPNSVQTFVKLEDAEEVFAQEYTRWLHLEDGTQLTSYSEGNVVDGEGKFKKLQASNTNLRFERVLYSRNADHKLEYQVDESLNVRFANSTTAATEANISLGLNNKLKVLTKTFDFTATSTGSMKFDTTFTLRSPQINILGNVSFGNSAAQPALLGNNLVNNALSPLFDLVSSVFSILSAEPALTTASQATLQASSQAVSAMKSSLSGSLSTKIKLSE